MYEGGVLIRAAEKYITTHANDIILTSTAVNYVYYTYNTDNQLTKKLIKTVGGDEFTTAYEHSEKAGTVSKFTVNNTAVSSRSKADHFGRKEFEEFQLGKMCISRRFSYHDGEVTDEHAENEKVRSSATTSLVKRIYFDKDSYIDYEYDKEDRISSVLSFRSRYSDSAGVRTTTETTETSVYTYDALGQLTEEDSSVNVKVTEKNLSTQAETITSDTTTAATTVITYDNYGNILSKTTRDGSENIITGRTHSYTYGNSTWKDLLTGFDGQSITYDDLGNPTSYLGSTLTWEKGRQLKSFGSLSYSYNANGIRTEKADSSAGGYK